MWIDSGLGKGKGEEREVQTRDVPRVIYLSRAGEQQSFNTNGACIILKASLLPGEPRRRRRQRPSLLPFAIKSILISKERVEKKCEFP